MPNDKPLSFMVFPQLSLEIREFLYKVVLTYIYIYIYLGAGKHPSPLDISESYSPDLYLKVGFYLIKKYCSCPKLSQFKDRALL